VKPHPFDADRLLAVEDSLFEAVYEIRRVFGSGKQGEIDVAELAYANSPGTCAFCPFLDMCQGATDATASSKPVSNSELEQFPLFLQVG
jgi:hypothetical protein